jgi:hypothetical protein
MGDSNKNGLQLISLILKPEHLISEIMLEGIGMQTVISGSKLHIVPPIKFNTTLNKCIVMATIEDQEWQDAYNTVKDNNPYANIDYLHGARHYKGWL